MKIKLATSLEEAKEILTNFNLPDDVRHPLIAGSDDWDNTISPTLYSLGLMLQPLFRVGGFPALIRTHRNIMETIYVLGYRRGKAEKLPVYEFVVAPEEG